MTTIVIMPGGFHPFHAGHLALYQSAQRAFPDADVYVAATDDTSTRPFPFKVKEKLAQLAGVNKGRFMRVKSPFRAEEITASYNPAKDVLIFVRSEKDSTKPPQPGGVKRDGSPSYLQPLLGAKRLEPFARHAYMAYLPTVEFAGGMKSASEIRAEWPSLDDQGKLDRVMSLYPRTQTSPKLAQTVVKLLDTAMGSEELNEFATGSGDGNSDEDPYKYPKPESYRRSVDFFGKFEAGHFDQEDFDDATGVFKGYWGPTQIAYFKFANPAKTSSEDPGMGWYYEPESSASNDTTAAEPAAFDNSEQRKQQELGMIDAFLKSGQTPKPGSQIYSLMKRHGVAEGSLNEFAVDGFGDSGDHRSKLLASVGRLFDAGNKVDWQVPGQMGHVTRVQDDGVTMKKWKMPHSRMSFFLPMRDDSRDKQYTIKMVAPKHYAVVSAEQGVAEGTRMPDANGNYKFHMFAYLRNGDIKEFNVIANGDRNAKILAKKKLIEKGYTNIYSIDIQGMSPVRGPVNYEIDRKLRLEDQGVAEASKRKQVPKELDRDPQLRQAMLYAKQHYPQHANDPEMALMKWLQRGLNHSEREDQQHDRRIAQLTTKVASITAAINQLKQQQVTAKNNDYLDE